LKKASAQKPGKEAQNFAAQRQATGLRKTRFDLPLDDQNSPSNSIVWGGAIIGQDHRRTMPSHSFNVVIANPARFVGRR
jgi:hypothetical protein